jgi:glutathionyl-hydroquinone reductase
VEFKDNHDDREFSHLINYLNRVYQVHDIREYNQKAFDFDKIKELDIDSFADLYEADVSPYGDAINDSEEALINELWPIVSLWYRSKSMY